MRIEKRIGCYTVRKIRKGHIMDKNEIMKVVAMYNSIMASLELCEVANTASNYEGDFLFVMCKGGTHYTNELGDIMPDAFGDDGSWYTCESMEETAAKYTELCLKAGCEPTDIYVGY